MAICSDLKHLGRLGNSGMSCFNVGDHNILLCERSEDVDKAHAQGAQRAMILHGGAGNDSPGVQDFQGEERKDRRSSTIARADTFPAGSFTSSIP